MNTWWLTIKISRNYYTELFSQLFSQWIIIIFIIVQHTEHLPHVKQMLYSALLPNVKTPCFSGPGPQVAEVLKGSKQQQQSFKSSWTLPQLSQGLSHPIYLQIEALTSLTHFHSLPSNFTHKLQMKGTWIPYIPTLPYVLVGKYEGSPRKCDGIEI